MIELCCEFAKWLSVRLRAKWLWFESRCSHLIFRYSTCFEQGVRWHSGNYRVWIHSETCTEHDKNIQTKISFSNVAGFLYLVVSLLLFYCLTKAGISFRKNTAEKARKYCFLFLEADHLLNLWPLLL